MEDKGRLDVLMLGADILVLWSTDNWTNQVGALHTVGWGSERRYFRGRSLCVTARRAGGGSGVCGWDVAVRWSFWTQTWEADQTLLFRVHWNQGVPSRGSGQAKRRRGRKDTQRWPVGKGQHNRANVQGTVAPSGVREASSCPGLHLLWPLFPSLPSQAFVPPVTSFLFPRCVGTVTLGWTKSGDLSSLPAGSLWKGELAGPPSAREHMF